MLRGVDGWRDDDLAFTKPWGFEPAAISVPMTVWQGGQDKMVPLAHGQWLAEALTGARLHLDAQEGHLSLMRSVGLILDDLLELAERT
jgi:pimeloyl-ACP methyl ester carboxylesterase